MPIIPTNSKLNATSTDILNVIRANASTTYQDFVPVATTDRDSVREIGAIIMQYPALQNEFLNSLINRIGRVIITSKMYRNPWAVFKKGILEFGETVEEIFVNIADPNNYNIETAESNVFKRKIPDVRTAFHVLNYQKFYKATIQNKQLQQAFLSWTGISDLIARIVDSMYTAAYYDEYQTMKFMLAKAIINGYLHAEAIPAPTTIESTKSIVTTIKGISNSLEFMSTKYNVAGVTNYTPKNKQVLILTAEADALLDVEVLASAFNMDKADFMGRRILMDNFVNMDFDRLTALFGAEEVEKVEPYIQGLASVPAILVDEDWFMIFDNLFEFTEQYNGEGMYWNYWYHVWKTFSYSPFANAVLFVVSNVNVTSVTVNPNTASITAGQTLQLTADVTTEGFASKAVKWTIENVVDGNEDTISDPDVNIDRTGKLYVGEISNGAVITVMAKSIENPEAYGTATITVA